MATIAQRLQALENRQAMMTAGGVRFRVVIAGGPDDTPPEPGVRVVTVGGGGYRPGGDGRGDDGDSEHDCAGF